MADRPIDIVVWGATGFTGKLVAEYLTKNYLGEDEEKKSIKLAIAGRSESRLNEIKKDLIKLNPAAANVSVLVGDSHDEASIDKIVKSTRVIISTVGPYMKYGSELVASCVKNSTDYVDITGETPWVRSLIDRHDAEAKKNGVMIVPMCGFDSIPADLGALFAVEHVKNQLKEVPTEVDSYVSLNGGVSGGTIDTMMNMMQEKKLGDIQNLFLLNPEDKRPIPTKHDQPQYIIGFSKDVNAWTAPFVMAAGNNQVVRRSGALLGYGPNFSYNEKMQFKRLYKAVGLTGGLAVFGAMSMFSCTRRLLLNFLPKPGQGPSLEVMKNGFFEYYVVATTDKGNKVHATVAGGEPGYSETAKMVSESALSLLLQKKELTGRAGGVLTTAAGMGNVLIKRLHKAGIKFEIKQSP